ncbi:hypothetical protein MYX65_01665 [Acidobacteria bacterium AH-259-L09]|nr:hypothetical protein [Acidobacteria bacterium AH-259-L09]
MKSGFAKVSRLGLVGILVLFLAPSASGQEQHPAGYPSGYPDITYDYVGSPVPISNPVVTYASWGDQNNRNIGLVFIYPLENGTDLNLFQETSTTAPIQISTLVLTVTAAMKDVPITFGPLTAPQHFFKLESNKPVNWELVTPDYNSFREASRFVASENRTFLGTKFVFHADDGVGFGVSQGTEEIVIINPGTTASTVTIEKFNTGTGLYDLPVATTLVPAGDFDEFAVNVSGLGKGPGKSLGTGRGHYRVTVTAGSPVLVWEGRWLRNNDAIGVAPDGSTIGNTIFASTPNDPSIGGASIGAGVILRIVGITAASYTVSSSPGPGSPFTVVRTGTVAAGGVASETALLEDHLYKITTASPTQKIQVQYLPEPLGSVEHGAEMIGGNDGGVATNPGTSFLFFFESRAQFSIDVLIPQAGTSVTVTGPSSTSLTSTVPDQVLHFVPNSGSSSSAVGKGLYTATATNPVWVVLTGAFGDQQGYFVYVSPTVGAPFSEPGDGNGDGKTNAADLVALMLEISDGDGDRVEDVGGGTFSGFSGLDVNGDGKVNFEDVKALTDLIFGK